MDNNPNNSTFVEAEVHTRGRNHGQHLIRRFTFGLWAGVVAFILIPIQICYEALTNAYLMGFLIATFIIVSILVIGIIEVGSIVSEFIIRSNSYRLGLLSNFVSFAVTGIIFVFSWIVINKEAHKNYLKQQLHDAKLVRRREALNELRNGGWLQKGYLRDEKFSDWDFTQLDWSDANLDGVQFERVNLTECNFDRASLKGASLREATLKNSSFCAANLRDADMQFAKCAETVIFDEHTIFPHDAKSVEIFEEIRKKALTGDEEARSRLMRRFTKETLYDGTTPEEKRARLVIEMNYNSDGTEIYATAFLEKSLNWFVPNEQWVDYLQANLNALERGIDITRVFFVKQEDHLRMTLAQLASVNGGQEIADEASNQVFVWERIIQQISEAQKAFKQNIESGALHTFIAIQDEVEQHDYYRQLVTDMVLYNDPDDLRVCFLYISDRRDKARIDRNVVKFHSYMQCYKDFIKDGKYVKDALTYLQEKGIC